MNSEIEKAQEEAIRAIQRNQQELLAQAMPSGLTPEQEEEVRRIKEKEAAMSHDELSLLNILRLSGFPNAENFVQHTPKSKYIDIVSGIILNHMSNLDICSSCILFIGDMLYSGSQKLLSETSLDVMIQTLKRHSGNIVITKQTLAILGNVLGTRDKATRTYVSKQLNTITDISKKYPTELEIQRGCCFVFSAIVDLARKELENVDGLTITLAIMKKFPADPSIQHNCCYILACFALDDATKKTIGINDGVSLVAAAMKKFADNARIQSYSAYALANLAHGNSENTARIRSAGCINLLASALKRFPDDAQAQSNICYALFTLSEDSAQNTKRMADLDVPSLIIPSIRAHSKVQHDVVSNGANALINILSSVPEKIPAFIEAKGVDAVVQGMSNALTDVASQRACLGLLIILSQSESNEARLAMGERATGPVVDAMKGYKTDIEVQMNALILVSNLLMNCPENQARFGSKGAVEAIISAMKANAKAHELQQAALQALTNLVFKSVPNKARVIAAEGIQAIREVMQNYDPAKVSFDLPRKSEYLSIQSTACMALINTCENSSEAQLKACECGCLDTVLALAKTNRAIAKTCYSTIMIMLSTPKAHAKYCTAKFIADVEGKSKGVSDNKDFQICLAALKRIQDPRAEDAVKRDVCTNTNIPLCKGPCPYKREKGYCVNCIGVQWVRYCATCSKKSNEYLIYCPVCWELHHKGHEGVKLFIPGRCECEEKGCHLESAKKAPAESAAPAPAPAAEKPKVQKKQQPANKKQQQQKKKAGKKK